MLEVQDEGFMPGYEEKTVFIPNYYEETIRGTSDSIQSLPDSPYKMYFPFVGGPDQLYSRSYYYAGSERIAMKKDGVVSYIYGDQLGSVSAVADGNGNLISKTLYHPWGTTRYAQGTSPTDYGYTGQMKEGDIYFYNARWYDPQLGRFMQTDALMSTAQ